ncbi:MAG: hypothetical protein RCO49_09620 [Rickettsia endosymbiont of Argas persicus]
MKVGEDATIIGDEGNAGNNNLAISLEDLAKLTGSGDNNTNHNQIDIKKEINSTNELLKKYKFVENLIQQGFGEEVIKSILETRDNGMDLPYIQNEKQMLIF